MADDAADIIERWKNHIPPRVPKDEVETVVDAYFAGRYRNIKKGSHFLIIEDEELRLLEEMGYPTGLQGGTLTLSLTEGRYVKEWLVRKLFKSIEVKEEWKRIKEANQ